jgi:hypothetical protein
MGLFPYVNAVFREMTNMFSSRDRSVVRSSVMPSAKYCCSRWAYPTATVAEEEFAQAFIGGCGIIFDRLSRMETHPSSRVEHEIGEP